MALNLHHVALTVTDTERSVAWYTDVLGLVELMREGHNGDGGGSAVMVGHEDWSLAIGLNYHPTNAGEAFDPTRTGLDHVGFIEPDRAGIEAWAARLDEKGVAHSGIIDTDWGSCINFNDPDGAQLQFIAFAQG